MKKLIVRVKAYFSLYRRLVLIREYIPNGFYYFRKNGYRKGIKMPLFFVISLKKAKFVLDPHFISIVETKFSNKITFVSNNYVLSYFKEPKKFSNSVNNYKQYKNLIGYKINPILDINYSKRFIITAFINGVEGDINKKIEALFEWNSRSKTKTMNYNYNKNIMDAFNDLKIDNIISYIQHGDFRSTNSLIEENVNKLICIDCDDLGYYPALFDFFWLVAWKPNCFHEFLNGKFDHNINKVLNLSGGGINSKDKDKYLAAFIVCAKYFGMGHHLGVDVIKIIPNKYLLSKKALNYITLNK